MNSPLPKPTPPVKNDIKQPNVVFDQSKVGVAPVPTTASVPTPTPVSDQTRIPLTQKPTLPSTPPTTPTSTSTSTTSVTPTAKTNLPPASLSALSSMSSNKIPTQSTGQLSTQMPEKTVLGQPIPQVIRGETVPKPSPQGGVPQPGSARTIAGSSATAGGVRPESPNISGKDNKKTTGSQSNQPKIAQAKSPLMKFLPFIVGGIVLLLVIVFVLSRILGGGSTSVSDNQAQTQNPQPGTTQQRTEVPAQKVVLEYWGLWEPTEVMDEVIKDFESENPGIEINYVKQSPVDYRQRLQTAFQSGSGPDIFRFHASWVPMLKNNLDPIPASVATASDFNNNYYPVVNQQLVSEGQHVGLPLMYDGLVLYYNQDILTTANESPPKTWPELRSLAVKLTVPSASGIQRAGLAIGNATNVEHFSDILATLILQNGGNLADADSVETRDALLFYTNFQLKDNVWNTTLPSSTVAFARGDVAMMFAPSWRAHDIKAMNPDLKFATAPMPQLSEDDKITWATYWAEGISASSSKKTDAAKFLAYLNRDDVLTKFYSAASKIRSFGEIYPKTSMAEQLADDLVIGPILADAVYAQSGYMNSYTHDNGLNDQTISYYKVAIDSLLQNGKIEEVQSALSQGVDQVLKQYSVNSK
jgi:multiple sugar transport system substrate-binding protein